jgi:putative SOS response-associated peptidase YedK
MCGRFTITLEAAELQEGLGLASIPADWQPRYNTAPTQNVGGLVDAGTRAVEWLRWGLIPSWAKDAEIGSRLINARAETVAEKPSFRQAFARRHCLILADGFYEWQHFTDKKKSSQPFYFNLLNGKPFAFAGLWEDWRSPQGKLVRSCTLITTEANSVVKPIHDRMPVILDQESMWIWLQTTDLETARNLLLPYPEGLMAARPVGRLVNDPGRDLPECILPENQV